MGQDFTENVTVPSGVNAPAHLQRRRNRKTFSRRCGLALFVQRNGLGSVLTKASICISIMS